MATTTPAIVGTYAPELIKSAALVGIDLTDHLAAFADPNPANTAAWTDSSILRTYVNFQRLGSKALNGKPIPTAAEALAAAERLGEAKVLRIHSRFGGYGPTMVFSRVALAERWLRATLENLDALAIDGDRLQILDEALHATALDPSVTASKLTAWLAEGKSNGLFVACQFWAKPTFPAGTISHRVVETLSLDDATNITGSSPRLSMASVDYFIKSHPRLAGMALRFAATDAARKPTYLARTYNAVAYHLDSIDIAPYRARLTLGDITRTIIATNSTNAWLTTCCLDYLKRFGPDEDQPELASRVLTVLNLNDDEVRAVCDPFDAVTWMDGGYAKNQPTAPAANAMADHLGLTEFLDAAEWVSATPGALTHPERYAWLGDRIRATPGMPHWVRATIKTRATRNGSGTVLSVVLAEVASLFAAFGDVVEGRLWRALAQQGSLCDNRSLSFANLAAIYQERDDEAAARLALRAETLTQGPLGTCSSAWCNVDRRDLGDGSPENRHAHDPHCIDWTPATATTHNPS